MKAVMSKPSTQTVVLCSRHSVTLHLGIMPLVQDRSLHLLTSNPMHYHCSTLTISDRRSVFHPQEVWENAPQSLGFLLPWTSPWMAYDVPPVTGYSCSHQILFLFNNSFIWNFNCMINDNVCNDVISHPSPQDDTKADEISLPSEALTETSLFKKFIYLTSFEKRN